MRILTGLAAAGIVTGLTLAAQPAAGAADCKEPVSAKARSAAQVSDASRERRARENAIDNWKKRARDTYGFRYSFWRKAQEKTVECGGGASAKHCTVSAKPCKAL